MNDDLMSMINGGSTLPPPGKDIQARSCMCQSLDLGWFGLREEVLNIFDTNMIIEPVDVINTLEIYKFVSRSSLIDVLNSRSFTDIPFSSLDSWQQDPDFAALEKKHGVLVVASDRRTANVYVRALARVNQNMIELELGHYSVNFYRLTPYNFQLLLDSSFVPYYDAMILFKRILLEALDLGATDLHFDTIHKDLKASYPVRCRIDSEMHDIDLFTLDRRLNQEIIGKLVESKTSATSVDLNSASGVTALVNDIFHTDDIELRVSAGKCIDGFHSVIRIQRKATFTFTLGKLGFADSVCSDLYEITRKVSGITLITGAIRTGKNTTAFALANEMLKRPIKAVSYEYPVEALMPMTQIDYMNDTNILLNAIRLAKKQDVNVAFLNEIPNKEVAFSVQDLVNSSIHVLTTMHLDRLWLLPYRLKEYYGSGYKDVISQINGIFNQKMFSVCCPYCGQQILVADIKHKAKRDLLMNAGLQTVLVNAGCEWCDYTGKMSGRNQPYVEHLLFDMDLVDQLLKCSEPYQMEIILREELFRRNQNLERYMAEGIRDSVLSVDALDAII